MKQFLIKLSVFILLLFAAMAAILIVPVDKRFQYAFVTGDCSPKSNYIYQRLYEDTTHIDIAFVGTSHTMCGISDSIVHRQLQAYGIQAVVANLAICRLGRNMDHMIIKDLLKNKSPRIIVLEVRQEESDRSHPDYGYKADIGDVLRPASLIDPSYLSDLVNALIVRMEYIRTYISGEGYAAAWEDPSRAIYRQTAVADITILLHGSQRRWERYYSQPRAAWIDSLMLQYPKAYIAEIMELVKKSHTKLVMLYIPNYGYPWHQPRELAYYRQVTDVYLMPDSFYDNKRYWIEDEHLNARGATILSDSVAAYLSRQLR